MIPPAKLARLPPRQRLRKAALVLTADERLLAEGDSRAAAHVLGVAAALAGAADLEEGIRLRAEALAGADSLPSGLPFRRALNDLRHALLAASGQAPADWDLLPPAAAPGEPGSGRSFHPGMRAYLEDIRSPFNVGSAFRSAEAFGLEELLLSPGTADPRHPRALRSAMGTVELVPWRRLGLGELEALGPVFALELGGTPIGEFDFPDSGTVILGSEELGVSPEARALPGPGAVSIPMAGLKGSLNAGVAFGILLHAWEAALRLRASSV